jgi:thiamine-phosphate pyrophosphorylase
MLDFRLYVVSNRSLVSDLVAFAREASAHGLKALQLREKDISDSELLALAQDIQRAAPDLHLIINERPDIAIACGAYGVHASEEGWPGDRLRAEFPNLTIGKSLHAATRDTNWNGLDYATFGPVYDTPSKSALGIGPRGLGALRQAVELAPVPLFAIGGMTPERAHLCKQRGVYGVAVMSDLLTARDIAARLAEYKEALGEL